MSRSPREASADLSAPLVNQIGCALKRPRAADSFKSDRLLASGSEGGSYRPPAQPESMFRRSGHHEVESIRERNDIQPKVYDVIGDKSGSV